jgi:hypothetical protein
MPSLSELQRNLRSALLIGDETRAIIAVAPDGIESRARLAIYRHHVFSSLTAGLRDTYPVVCRLVDERFFAYAADAFVRRHLPTGPCLFEYGEAFAEFLADFPPCRALPYLPDVARLEWALNVAYHAAPAPILAASEIAAVPPADLPRLRLRFNPSVSLLASPYPVDQIWQANQPGTDADAIVDLDAGASHLMTFRRYGDAVWERLSPASYAFRVCLASGDPLERAAEAALALDENLDLAGELRALFTSCTEETNA